jgi:hypothetical protein
MNILYINTRINSDIYIACKTLVLINTFIKRMSLSKNIILARKLTRYSFLNALKDKERK